LIRICRFGFSEFKIYLISSLFRISDFGFSVFYASRTWPHAHQSRPLRGEDRRRRRCPVLSVNRAELAALLEQEPLFDRVEIEIAHPGESCRILRVPDVLEPRYRLNGLNFPGALDGNGLVGDGHARALKNVAVVETNQLATRSRSLIDMSGPAAEYSPIANTHNVVLLPYPKKNADEYDAVHSGYDTAFANQDPNRLVPLDTMRELERDGVIGKVHEFVRSTGGAHAAVENATQIGQQIADQLKAAGVNGVILTST
jgi:hypothetical protein